MTKKISIKFGTRPLGDGNGNFGTHVITYVNGQMETDDQNLTPYADERRALERARQIAITEAQRFDGNVTVSRL